MTNPLSPDEASDSSRTRLADGRRVAATATALTLVLVGAKGFFGYVRHSPALWADALHSAADTLAIFASWLGLRLASRKPTQRFPFGLYRAETLASLVVSAIILVAGLDLLVDSVAALASQADSPARSIDVLVVALTSAVVSYGIFLWERRVGQRIQSQSLLANADESKADVLTSSAVFCGTGATYLGVAGVELVVAAGLSLLILWLGAKNGLVAIYALLDASLDRELEKRIGEIAQSVPGAKEVGRVRLRRAGPFRFGIAEVRVQKSTDVARAHEVAHQVERAVRAEIPNVEMLTVHLEPFQPAEQNAMVPAEGRGLDATVSEHFARAQYFLFATLREGEVEGSENVENAFRSKKARAALAVIKDALGERQIDAVLTREIGEIAFHTLRDHYVAVYSAPESTVGEALAEFAQGRLSPLTAPTHASRAAAAPDDGEEEHPR
ncbi:MAG: cation diffusion facilitator family transporter [bacterium]